MTFQTQAGSFTLGGDSVTLNGNIVNNSDNLQTVDLPLVLAADSTINTVAGNVSINGNISDNGGDLGIIKIGKGKALLGGSNTYGGDTVVAQGTVVFTSSNAVATASTLVIDDGASVVLAFDSDSASTSLAFGGSNSAFTPAVVAATSAANLARQPRPRLPSRPRSQRRCRKRRRPHYRRPCKTRRAWPRPRFGVGETGRGDAGSAAHYGRHHRRPIPARQH